MRVGLQVFRRLSATICGLVCFSALSQATAEPDSLSARQLLARMSTASHHTSYRGTFTYQQRGALKTFKVFHLVRDNEEFEKLVHMDGASAEVIRPGNPLHCKRAGQGLLDSSAGDSRIEQLYHLKITGDDRVANRPVTELQLIPRDTWRHGYVFSIDKQSGLLLRTLMIANDGQRLLERFQFVDVEIGPGLSGLQLQSTEAQTTVAGVETLPCNDYDKLGFGLWKVHWLPEGFVLAGVKRGEGASENLMFTDGIGFFSVFVEPQDKDIPSGSARRGATVVAMTRAAYREQNYSVSVVGEIPLRSAKRIARSVRAQIQ